MKEAAGNTPKWTDKVLDNQGSSQSKCPVCPKEKETNHLKQTNKQTYNF